MRQQYAAFSCSTLDRLLPERFEVPLRDNMADVIDSILQARLVLRYVEPGCCGRLEVDDAGQPVIGREFTSRGNWKAPGPGGALPAFAGMDSEMIAGLTAELGPEGSRCTGQSPPFSGSGRDTQRIDRSGSSGPREPPNHYKPPSTRDDCA